MAVRHHMFFENSNIKRVLIELGEVVFSLETHEDSMGILFRILIRNTPYRNKRCPVDTFDIQTIIHQIIQYITMENKHRLHIIMHLLIMRYIGKWEHKFKILINNGNKDESTV